MYLASDEATLTEDQQKQHGHESIIENFLFFGEGGSGGQRKGIKPSVQSAGRERSYGCNACIFSLIPLVQISLPIAITYISWAEAFLLLLGPISADVKNGSARKSMVPSLHLIHSTTPMIIKS